MLEIFLGGMAAIFGGVTMARSGHRRLRKVVDTHKERRRAIERRREGGWASPSAYEKAAPGDEPGA